MNIDKLNVMSLGSGCASLLILGYGAPGEKPQHQDIRTKGPVDNLWCYGIENTISLLNGDFKAQLDKGPREIKDKLPHFEGDSDKEYVFSTFSIMHNTWDENFIKKINERLNNFNTFFEESKSDPNKIFIYTIDKVDVNMGAPTSHFMELFEELKKLIDPDKVLFIGNKVGSNKNFPFRGYLDKLYVNKLGIKYIELENIGDKNTNANEAFLDALKKYGE